MSPGLGDGTGYSPEWGWVPDSLVPGPTQGQAGAEPGANQGGTSLPPALPGEALAPSTSERWPSGLGAAVREHSSWHLLAPSRAAVKLVTSPALPAHHRCQQTVWTNVPKTKQNKPPRGSSWARSSKKCKTGPACLIIYACAPVNG